MSRSNFKTEKYPLPGSIEGILNLMREALSAGQVQRFELEVGKPVRVVRKIDVGDPDLEEPNIDLDGALRNVQLLEYISEGASSFQVVVDLMQNITSRGLYPVCWATGTSEEPMNPLLEAWLEFKWRDVPGNTDFLLGIPVTRLKHLPEDSLIICGSEYPSADHSEITLAVKAAIEFRSDDDGIQSREAVDPVWDNPAERDPTPGQPELAPGGLFRVEWRAPGDSGK